MAVTGNALEATNLFAAMVWVGGLVAVAVATAAARASLGEAQQVEFFRALGKRYGLISGTALAVFALTGLSLLGAPGGWSGKETVTAVLVLAVAGLTVTGVRAAQRTQQARSQSLMKTADREAQARLVRASRISNGLRVLIAISTLAAFLVATF